MDTENKFLYIPASDKKRSIELLYFLSELMDMKMFVPWFYPEASKKSVAKLYNKVDPYIFRKRALEVVTSYDDLGKNKRAIPILMFRKNLRKILDEKYESILDSLAFYPADGTRWLFSYVVHENMIITKSDIAHFIDDTAIEYHKSPPEYW